MTRQRTLLGLGLILALSLAGCWPAGEVQSVTIASQGSEAAVQNRTTPSFSAEPTPDETSTPSPSPTAVIDYRPDEIEPSAAFLFPLTIQHLTTSSATVHFELVEPRQGRLVLWLQDQSPTAAFVFPFEADRAQQSFVIDGLESGASYVVGVGIAGADGVFRSPQYYEQLWGPITFTVPEANSYPLRIAAIGDSGYGEQATFELAELMASYQPDFVLHTGDLVYLAQNNLNPT
ncbi:MAG: metallophosphoesterase, partial [Anaerolineales bacterium]